MKEFADVEKVLSIFPPITLEQMAGIRLMNRTDTKFIIPLNQLSTVLELSKQEYKVQQVEEEKNIAYHTVYLDTQDRDMFNCHQNGRKVREKIRVRSYVRTGISFLEIKNKNNKGRTDKKRIRVESAHSLDKDGGDKFLKEHAWYTLDNLLHHLENNFHRVTLVNNKMTERLTIDTNICFRNFLTEKQAQLDKIAIIELKRDGNTFSPMLHILQKLRVHPASISKYCIGSVLTDSSLKYNRFKSKIRHLEKLEKQTTI